MSGLRVFGEFLEGWWFHRARHCGNGRREYCESCAETVRLWRHR